MALHDNPIWVLSHIQNSFVVSDDTGNSELVLQDDVKKHLGPLAQREGATPYLNHHLWCQTLGDDEEDDGLSRSVEIRARNPISSYRQRCNTERKLEKLKHERNKIPDVKTVSWREFQSSLSDDGVPLNELFPKKNKSNIMAKSWQGDSLLSRKLKTSPEVAKNPFIDYSKHEAGDTSANENKMKIRVFLTGIIKDWKDQPDASPPYIKGVVHPGTLVRDVIGYLCWKYTSQSLSPALNENVDAFALYLAEGDGSIDWDLKAIDRQEPISKFGLSEFALVDVEGDASLNSKIDVKVTLPDGTFTVISLASKDITAKSLIDRVMTRRKVGNRVGIVFNFNLEPKSSPGKALDPSQSLNSVDDTEFFIVRENSRRCAEFEPSQTKVQPEFNALDAATYQEYRDVWLVTKIKSKLAVVLAISQDKVDIFPHQTPSSRLWNAATIVPFNGSIEVEHVVGCDITEKSDEEDLWTFRFVVEHKPNLYKKVYFQTMRDTAEEIHKKISNLLSWHSSRARSNYIVYKELKNRRRKTNLF